MSRFVIKLRGLMFAVVPLLALLFQFSARAGGAYLTYSY